MTDLRELDAYVLKARVVPVLWLLLPLGAIAALLGVGRDPVLAAVAGLGGSGTIALLGADAVRGLGRNLEERIWASQGGAPSTRAFLDDHATARDRRSRLATVTGVDVTDDADSVRRGESVLRELTDEDRFKRLRIANTDYGRARHLLALRPYGLAMSALCAIVAVYVLAGGLLPGDLAGPDTASGIIAVLTCLLLTLFWAVVPSREAYERAAYDYADRLLAALDVLAADPDGTGRSEP